MSLISRLFPKTIDNSWRGPWAAVVILVLVVLMKASTSLGSVLAPRRVALGPDGLPIDRVSPEAAEVMLRLLTLVGFDQLVLALVAVLALVRYRAMIPLAFLLLLIEQGGRRLLNLAHPTAQGAGAPVGVYINLAILALMVIGFLLSLTERREAKPRRAF